MSNSNAAQSWLHPTRAEEPAAGFETSEEIARQWQGFMTARLVLGFVLVALQTVLQATGTVHDTRLIAISWVYLFATLTSKLLIQPRRLGQSFNRVWAALVGIDLLTFTALQVLQSAATSTSTINYTPLFALPVLLASVLGSMGLALGTAAGITVLMLGISMWAFVQSASDSTPYLVQPALSGVGYFAIAWLSNQLSSRLATEGQRARQSQLAAKVQRQVNELVIESLADGVLIVDANGLVRAANPAARQLLESEQALDAPVFDLNDQAGWQPLLSLTQHSFATGEPQEQAITILHGHQGPRRVRARTRITEPQGTTGERLCVLFLQDQRELEARMRTEKLAGMGRLSTAVAHEIRNPLSAITQANALLDEDVSDPKLKRLTAMVSQNAKRLEKIVNDILNISRAQPYDPSYLMPNLPLDSTVHRVCSDWAAQCDAKQRLVLRCDDPLCGIRFDIEHLRRVLVNLLDNALRHTANAPDAIQVITGPPGGVQANISVWSEGPPMDQSVERHLFEPFFSSDSRSSGLGLFICRELCERHGASLIYQRSLRNANGLPKEGNEFLVTLVREQAPDNANPSDNNSTPWQAPLY